MERRILIRERWRSDGKEGKVGEGNEKGRRRERKLIRNGRSTFPCSPRGSTFNRRNRERASTRTSEAGNREGRRIEINIVFRSRCFHFSLSFFSFLFFSFAALHRDAPPILRAPAARTAFLQRRGERLPLSLPGNILLTRDSYSLRNYCCPGVFNYCSVCPVDHPCVEDSRVAHGETGRSRGIR